MNKNDQQKTHKCATHHPLTLGIHANISCSVCVLIYSEFTNLCKLQSVEGIGWIGELEELFEHDPGLQGFQLAGCQVSGMMPDQVSLEFIRQEVDVDRHRMSHGKIPEDTKEVI